MSIVAGYRNVWVKVINDYKREYVIERLINHFLGELYQYEDASLIDIKYRIVEYPWGNDAHGNINGTVEYTEALVLYQAEEPIEYYELEDLKKMS